MEVFMETEFYLKYKEKIKDLVENLGIDRTDDYLVSRLSELTRNVAALREEVEYLNKQIKLETNSDEVIHLRHDIEEKNELLTELLDKLMGADMMYICFKEYIRK